MEAQHIMAPAQFEMIMSTIGIPTGYSIKHTINTLGHVDLNKTQGENIHTLVLLKRGDIEKTHNISPSRVPPNLVDLVITPICNASNIKFTEIFTGMNNIRKHTAYQVNSNHEDGMQLME